MRKSLSLISCVAALALSTSCSTIHNTATTAAVDTQIYNLTVADLKVAPEKASKTTSWSWNPFNQVNLDREKKNTTAGILRETGSDILVEPQYEIHRRGIFRGGSLTVTGYPATYSNFHAMSREEAENLAIVNGNLTVTSTTAAPTVVNANDIVAGVLAGATVQPFTKHSKKKKDETSFIGRRHKTDFGTRRFVDFIGGPTVSGGFDDGKGFNVGLIYGQYRSKWGFYVKGEYYNDGFEAYHDYETYRRSTGYVTIGAIKTLPSGFNIMAGLGAGGCIGSQDDFSRVYYPDDCIDADFAVPVEVMLQWNHKKFNIMAGVTTFLFKTYEYTDTPVNLMIGIGFNF